MVRGRPPKPGTAEEKAAARKERVRNNVRALRERRRKETALFTRVHTQCQPASRGVSSTSSSDYVHTDSDSTFYESTDRSCDEIDDVPNSSITRNDRAQSRLVLGLNVDTRGLYAMALLSCMRESFLPDSVYLPPAVNTTNGRPWESEQFLWTPCAFWISTAFSKASAQESGVLRTVLLAIGTMLKSLEYSDHSLKVSALELYRRAISGIRKQLTPLIADRSARPKDTVSFYLGCHAAAMFELLLSSDLTLTMHHLRGVSQLICHLGDGRDEEGQSIAWLLLQDYRFAEMALCMKYRYRSFSSTKRQQFEANTFDRLELSNRSASAHGHGSHNMLVKITDLADDISAIMVELDSTKSRSREPNNGAKIQRLLTALGKIWSCFKELRTSLVSRYGTFLQIDLDADDSSAGSVKFKSFDIGAAWCYNLMVQTYCLETSIEAMSLLQCKDAPPQYTQFPKSSALLNTESFPPDLHDIPIVKQDSQSLRWLQRAVCLQLTQCLNYFLQTDKGLTGQALAIFPLDAAVSMLGLEMPRLIADLRHTKLSSCGDAKLTQIHKDIAAVAEAQHFCQMMQDRAKSFGLPGFAAGEEFAQTLRKDQALYDCSYSPFY